jgi:DNA-binding SARP family transcriptional activator
MMRVQVLGPVRAWRDGGEVPLGQSRQQAVLAMLVLAGGQPVSRAELVDALWADDPPPSAVNVIHIYVMNLRRLLEPGRRPRAASQILPNLGTGYALRLPDEDVDVWRFRRLISAAENARRAGDDAGAAELLRDALGLWLAEPLAGIDVLSNHPMRVALIGERRAAAIRYGEAALAAGVPADAVPVLEAAAAADPLDESVHALLIRAHAAAGRRGRSFVVYRDLRRRLAEELGADPGPEVVAAHGIALQDENQSAATAIPVRTERAVPAQLPPDVSVFTGREREVSVLDELVAAPVKDPDKTALLIFAVTGTAGVGKTALAIHWAHRVRDRFPDGQLYVDLRGYDPEGPPLTPGEVLARFLRALGAPGRAIPADVDERAASFRTALDQRRLLVVLDNASSTDQVRSLLPGTASCLVVVTSRDSLPGLVTRHGARRVVLDALPEADAVALLGRLIGERVATDRVAAAEMARQCACLPLALRIAAHLVTDRPGTALVDVVRELANGQQRLDLLTAGDDPRTAVRSAFSCSYRHLSTDAARAFRRLGLHPGPTPDRYAAAALAGTGPDRLTLVLDRLARANLIQRAGPDRFALHDLLRAYAAELAAEEDGCDGNRQALARLFDCYLHTALAAVDLVYPAERNRRPRLDVPEHPGPDFVDADAARAWLDREWPNLAAAIDYGGAHGWPDHAVRLTLTLARYLYSAGQFAEAIGRHGSAIRAARQVGDRAGECQLLNSRAHFHIQQAAYAQAVDDLRQSQALAAELDDRTAEARASGNLGLAYLWLGQYAEAGAQLQRAHSLFRETGDRLGEASALGSLGHLDLRLGYFRRAAERLRDALVIAREVGDRTAEARILGNLGHIDLYQGFYDRAADHFRARDGLGEACLGQGRQDEAAAHHRAAAATLREIGDRSGEGRALRGLGDVLVRQGSPGPALAHLRQALTLVDEVSDVAERVRVLNSLGAAWSAAGDLRQAITQHHAALAQAVDLGDRLGQAHAHAGLARAISAAGDPDGGRRHGTRAVALFVDLELTPALIGEAEADWSDRASSTAPSS